MQKQDFVVRFAGEGGQGVVTSAEILAQAAAQGGYHVQTYATFPSQIMGGPTWAQARVSAAPVLSGGDDVDVLVAFNREAYDTHFGELRDGGILIYNSAEFQVENNGHAIGLPVDELAKQAGNARAANMVILGVLAQLIGWPEKTLNEFVVKRFSRGRAEDEAIIKANLEALRLGREAAASSSLTLGHLPPANRVEYKQLLLKGNEALALGAMAADLDVFVGYPISPATPILIFMERNLVGPKKFAYQASSEIESINAILGAGYAGKKAMTSTAGPGFSLMSEGLGLAWMAEVPCVVVDVQRGGPATGLPTKTEQSDLFKVMRPAHGDVVLPVIAPGTVEECFYAAVHALNWAERYQGPVVVLSEMMLAEQTTNIRKPDLGKLTVEKRQVYQGSNGYMRYEAPGLSPMPIPGGPGAYVANGSEHDPIGDTTHLPHRHVQMTERRFSKLKLLEDGTYERENAEEPVVLMPWGGSKGPAREAYERLLAEGTRLGWYYTMFLHPLPPKLLEELRQKELVLVPELNYQGQFSAILRSLGVKAESITQYTGLPFKPRDLVTKVTERIRSRQGRMVRA